MAITRTQADELVRSIREFATEATNDPTVVDAMLGDLVVAASEMGDECTITLLRARVRNLWNLEPGDLS